MTRRKDGLWTQSVTINGKRKYFYGKTKQEVLRKINQYKRRISEAHSFRAVYDEWYEEYAPRVSTGTLANTRYRSTKILSFFGNYDICDITAPIIADYVESISSTLGIGSVRANLSIISMIYDYAIRKGYVTDNPAARIKAKGITRPRRTSPTSDTIAKVKSSAHLPFGLFAVWLMYTGCRRGELLALEWNDVDIDNRTIDINKTLYISSSACEIHPTKTRAGTRTIPLLDALLPYIPQNRAGLIFPDTATNTSYMTYSHYITAWNNYVKQSKIDRSATPHTFRHLFATMLFEQGIPPEQAQIILGHSSLKMTMDLYRDIRRKMQIDVGRKILSADIE